jgi:hypothetical protein
MPARHRHLHSSERWKSFTITLESLFTFPWNRASRNSRDRAVGAALKVSRRERAALTCRLDERQYPDDVAANLVHGSSRVGKINKRRSKSLPTPKRLRDVKVSAARLEAGAKPDLPRGSNDLEQTLRKLLSRFADDLAWGAEAAAAQRARKAPPY